MGKGDKKRFNDRDEGDLDFDYNTGKMKKIKTNTPVRVVTSFPTGSFKDVKNFNRFFWLGDLGEDPPSVVLKEKRKALGVQVRGPNLSNCPSPVHSICDQGLPDHFREVFQFLKLDKPSPVQAQCWPSLLCGTNVIGLAPTGTGKTLAYTLPCVPHVLSRVFHLKTISGPFALIIVPTRELAIQVDASMKCFLKLFNLRSMAVYGGQDRTEQIDMLRSTSPKILVATPGRLCDLADSCAVDLSLVSYFVLDEADRMLAMGFAGQLASVASRVRPDRQTVLFSATFPGRLRDTAQTLAPDAIVVRCGAPPNSADSGGDASDITSNSERQDSDKGSWYDHEKATRTHGDLPGIETAAIEPGHASHETAQEKAVKEDVSFLDLESSSLTVSSLVAQKVHVCAEHKKPRLLIKYFLATRRAEKEAKQRQPGPMIIFCNKIKTAKFVFEFLKKHLSVADSGGAFSPAASSSCAHTSCKKLSSGGNPPVQRPTSVGMSSGAGGIELLYGGLAQEQRERLLREFKAGKLHTLCATDVAARGLHVKRLRYVVNYDFPATLEQYCHRIGRAGRQSDVVGEAYSLITRNMNSLVPDLIALMTACGQPVEPNLRQLTMTDEVDDVGIQKSSWIARQQCGTTGPSRS